MSGEVNSRKSRVLECPPASGTSAQALESLPFSILCMQALKSRNNALTKPELRLVCDKPNRSHVVDKGGQKSRQLEVAGPEPKEQCKRTCRPRYCGEQLMVAVNLDPAIYTVQEGDDLTSIARHHLAPYACAQDVFLHSQEIAQLNSISSKAELIPGRKLQLPGRTINGGFVTDTFEGRTTVWSDGAVRVNRMDGSGGYVVRADGSRREWGPSLAIKARQVVDHGLGCEINTPVPEERLTVMAARSRLLHEIQRQHVQQSTAARLRQYMSEFEERAKASGIDAQAVVQTYNNIHQVLTNTASHRIPHLSRVQISERLMQQAARADVSTIDEQTNEEWLTESLLSIKRSRSEKHDRELFFSCFGNS